VPFNSATPSHVFTCVCTHHAGCARKCVCVCACACVCVCVSVCVRVRNPRSCLGMCVLPYDNVCAYDYVCALGGGPADQAKFGAKLWP
jgi:hypothetical protein